VTRGDRYRGARHAGGAALGTGYSVYATSFMGMGGLAPEGGPCLPWSAPIPAVGAWSSPSGADQRPPGTLLPPGAARTEYADLVPPATPTEPEIAGSGTPPSSRRKWASDL
jgi:hypothetical protein